MGKSMTAEEVLPLIAKLTPRERLRLLRLMTADTDLDAALEYGALTPQPDEFSTDLEPLSWEAEGWEEVAD